MPELSSMYYPISSGSLIRDFIILYDIPQNKTAQAIHKTRNPMENLTFTRSFKVPAKTGDGKSPNKCMHSMEPAMPCPRRYSGTLLRILREIGPVSMNRTNSKIVNTIKKKTKSVINIPGMPIDSPIIEKVISISELSNHL